MLSFFILFSSKSFSCLDVQNSKCVFLFLKQGIAVLARMTDTNLELVGHQYRSRHQANNAMFNPPSILTIFLNLQKTAFKLSQPHISEKTFTLPNWFRCLFLHITSSCQNTLNTTKMILKRFSEDEKWQLDSLRVN